MAEPTDRVANISVTTRSWLAYTLVGLSTVGIVAISGILLWFAKSPYRAGRLVFAGVLPLLGSWVGTVLAFYFSRESIEAATSSAERLTNINRDRNLKNIPVTKYMIPLDKIDAIRVDAGDERTVKLIDITGSNNTRSPIFDTENKIRYMIHRSLADRFIASLVVSGKADQSAVKNLTLADMVSDQEIAKIMTTSFVTVKSEDTLASAKEAMEITPSCQDVFVTKDGTKASVVLGWITNVEIGKAGNPRELSF